MRVRLLVSLLVVSALWRGMVGEVCAAGAEGERVGVWLDVRPPEKVVPIMRLEVGHGVREERGWSGRDFTAGLPSNVEGDVRQVRRMVLRSRGILAELMEELEVGEEERPWSQTMTVRVPMGVGRTVVPFLALANETHAVLADVRRFGVGGGLLWKMGRNGSMGMEAVYLGGSGQGGEAFGSELRVMGRMQWGF